MGTLTNVNVFAKFYADNVTNEDCWWWRSNGGAYHVRGKYVPATAMTPVDRTGAASGGHGFATSLDDWHWPSHMICRPSVA